MTSQDSKMGLAAVRSFFDEAMYGMVDFRLSFEAPIGPSGFPAFEALKRVIARLDPVQQTLFRLFRLGALVGRDAVEEAIPDRVLQALARNALLRRQDEGWRTPSLLLVPLEGLLVFVSAPAAYPTSTDRCFAWFDLSSYVFAKALPDDLAGLRVLDICSGTGIQSLLAARRGAAAVIGLELDADAVTLAARNAAVNGVPGVEFRVSDGLAALRPDESFDFILCNGPHAPTCDGERLVSSLDAIGNRVLLSLADRLPSRLGPDGRALLALWRSIGSQRGNAQLSLLKDRFMRAGFGCDTFSDPAADGIEGLLRILKADAAQRHGAAAGDAQLAAARALLAAGPVVEGTYNQLLMFKRGSGRDFGLSTLAAAEGE